MLTTADMEIVWNPYFTRDTAEDASERMARRNALVQQLRTEGYRLQIEQLYHPSSTSGGLRVGLFDSAGCIEERFYTREGRGDIKRAIRTMVNIDGRAPSFWATEAL